LPNLKNIAEQVFEAEKVDDVFLSIALVDKKTICQLNKEYRDVDSPTDVLSFNFQKPGKHKSIDGEVIICPEVAREGLSEKQNLFEEIVSLLVHGILHLLNYNHEKVEEAKKMEQRQRQLLSAFSGGITSRK
jgi:probable rRNA maturation factor